jgi:hypothetical protein
MKEMSSTVGIERTEDSGETDSTSNSAIYLLRTTQQHHVQLSAMADQKASILMGAAFVVLTILVGQMKTGGLSIAAVTLGVFALLSALFAVLALIPRIHAKTSRDNDSNLLFFGSFADLSPEEYLTKMERLIRSDQDVHRMMIVDIYQMGKILHEKKFKYLTYSYQLFLVGLITTFVVVVGTYVISKAGF